MKNATHLAIIGYGYMGHIYRQAALDLGRKHRIETYYKYDLPDLIRCLELKAIVDITFDQASYCEEDELWYFPSIEEMLEHEELGIDAAIVSVPTKDHFETAKKLISHRISLLIEKPVCETAAEIAELISMADYHGVRIMPGHVERYNPVTLDALEAVEYQMYGEVTEYSLKRTSLKPKRVKDNLIIDKLIHDIDLVQCLFGSFSLENLEFRKDGDQVVECRITTRHDNGLKGSIFSSWLVPEKERSITIGFQRGKLYGDFLEKTIHIDRYMEFSKVITGYKNSQIKDQLGDFIAFKCSKIKTLVNIQDALSSAYIIDEISRRTAL